MILYTEISRKTITMAGVNAAEAFKKAYQAHHAFSQTQEFDDFFKRVGLDKHDAKFGSWVETSQHRKEAAAYNKKWRDFISNNPEASLQQVINEGKRIMKLFGYKINF